MIDYSNKLVKTSSLNKSKLIKLFGISRSKFYEWVQKSDKPNIHNGKIPKVHWITPDEKSAILEFAAKHINEHRYYVTDGYRRIAYLGLDAGVFACSPASVYRVLSSSNMLSKWKNTGKSNKGTGFNQPDKIHQHWHTDIKYIIIGGVFFYLMSIIDGYSRYIVYHEIRVNMAEYDVTIIIQKALEKYPAVKPRLISDNGSQYKAKEFGEYLKLSGLQHVRTSPSYPQSNGKIERFHRSIQQECVNTTSMINLDDARKQIDKYIEHYNNQRLHSALKYLPPIDVFTGKADEKLKIRKDKLAIANENRKKYWEQINNVA